MTRRFTKRNKQGIKTRSTLLTGLEKMRNLMKEAKTTKLLTKTNNVEKTLNDMAKWLVAVEKCPPRHYGKVWNDEKQQIVEQCRRMYMDAQRLAQYQADQFMGIRRDRVNMKNSDGDGRFMPMSRLKWNMATAKWDFTNRPTIGSNPYWNADQAKKKQKVRIIKDNPKSWALYDLSVQLMGPEEDTEDAMQKVVQITNGKTVFNESPFSEWKQNYKPMKNNKGYHVGYY